MENSIKLTSAYDFDEIVGFKRNENEKEHSHGRVVAIRFSKEKVFYDIVDNYYGQIYQNIDSLNVQKLS
jgi:hypothetical protein